MISRGEAFQTAGYSKDKCPEEALHLHQQVEQSELEEEPGQRRSEKSERPDIANLVHHQETTEGF